MIEANLPTAEEVLCMTRLSTSIECCANILLRPVDKWKRDERVCLGHYTSRVIIHRLLDAD